MSLGGREGGTSAALYLIEGSTLREAGAINGIATLDASGTLTPDQVPASIANGLTFQATWNANTNTPTLPPVSTPDPGDYWIVTTAGSTALPGAAGPWTVGQVAVFNGVDWDALSMYPLAVGLPVAGASAGDVLYVNGSAVLAYAAPGTTSGVQAYSAALAAIATNGTPTAWGLARMLDANQAANQTALGLGTAAYISSTAGGDLSGTLPSPTVAKVSGTTPGATGLSVLAAGSESAGRSALGLGTISTQASNNVSITGGSISGITDLAVADGGTGASTAPLARAGLSANGGGWRTTSSGTDTLVGGDGVVEYTASCTITLPSASESGVFVGKTITLIAATAGIVLTLRRAGSDTLNGGTADVAVTMSTARGTLAVVAQSASAWGSLQPGELSANAIRVYASGSSIYAVTASVDPATGTVTDIGTPVVGTATGTDYSETISASKITIPAGAASSGAVESNSRRYTWTIAELGMSAWTVANPRIFVGTISGTALSDESEARSGTAAMLVGLGTGTATLIASTGLARTSTGTTYSATTVIGSVSMATNAPGAGAVRASMVCDMGTSSSGNRDISTYDSTGTRLANANTSGATIPSGAPTHVLFILSRTGTTPSAFSITGLSALLQTVPTR